ncbi:hypothetical protein, partial [Kitasatospora griseola]|uniref:hypothetical protein n=1 Tax=Kitasatospora griseola TaxID=2064 RepID=UPI003660617D
MDLSTVLVAAVAVLVVSGLLWLLTVTMLAKLMKSVFTQKSTRVCCRLSVSRARTGLRDAYRPLAARSADVVPHELGHGVLDI